MIKEFRDFINQGNLVDMAVAFVMGLAFSTVVNTFTNNIVNPLIGMILPGIDDLAEFGRFGVSGSIGIFLVAIINFLIVGFAMFLVVKAYNRMRRTADEAPAEPTQEVQLLTEIRDSLNRQG